MLWQVIQPPRLMSRLEHFARSAKQDQGGIVTLRRRKKVLQLQGKAIDNMMPR